MHDEQQEGQERGPSGNSLLSQAVKAGTSSHFARETANMLNASKLHQNATTVMKTTATSEEGLDEI